MANYSECYIEFEGKPKVLSELEAFITDESFYLFCPETVEIEDSVLKVHGSAKWQLNIEQLASDICEHYNVSANGYDAEQGSDFFIKFGIDNEGGAELDEYDYICEESIKTFGEEYFACQGEYCYEGDSKGALEHLRYLESFKNFENFTKEEFESFFIGYTNSKKKTSRELASIKKVLKTMPKIGESILESMYVVLIKKNILLCEAQTEGKKTRALLFNTKLKEWSEEVLEDIEMHTFNHTKLNKHLINLA